jgi:hypothetical protein
MNFEAGTRAATVDETAIQRMTAHLDALFPITEAIVAAAGGVADLDLADLFGEHRLA